MISWMNNPWNLDDFNANPQKIENCELLHFINRNKSIDDISWIHELLGFHPNIS
jgi:hypothetical protein